MIRKRKKTRKYRGNRFQGYGQQGQHRGGGQRGGAGRTGYEKHHWIRTLKYEPERIKQVGFTRPPRLVEPHTTINLGQLDEAIPSLIKSKIAKQEGKTLTINLAELGVTKLLGKGRLTQSLEITVASASAKAQEKVKESGGKINLPESTTSPPPDKK